MDISDLDLANVDYNATVDDLPYISTALHPLTYTPASTDHPTTSACTDHQTASASTDHPTTPVSTDHPTAQASTDHPKTTANTDNCTTPAKCSIGILLFYIAPDNQLIQNRKKNFACFHFFLFAVVVCNSWCYSRQQKWR